VTTVKRKEEKGEARVGGVRLRDQTNATFALALLP